MLAIIQKIIVELRLVTKIFGSLNSTMHFFFSNQIRRISPPFFSKIIFQLCSWKQQISEYLPVLFLFIGFQINVCFVAKLSIDPVLFS